MSALPKALNFGLARFEAGAKDLIKITPLQKLVFGDSETLVFRLPTSGTLDTASLSMIAKVNVAGTIAAAGNDSLNNIMLGDFFSRFEVLAGGQSIFGSSCSDFAQAYRMRRQIAEPQYVNGSSNRLFDAPLLTSVTATTYLMMNDIPWNFQCRYVPTAAFPELELRFTTRFSSVPLPTGATGVTSIEPYLLVPRVSIPGEASVENLVARRLAMGSPLELAYENWSFFTGQPFSADGTFNISIACQSLNHLAVGFKLAGQTGVTYANSAAPTTTGQEVNGSVQMLINGVPTSSWPLNYIDAWWKLLEALDGHSTNLAVDPQVSAITAVVTGSPSWLTRRYMFLERFSMPTYGDENGHLISGLNTYNQQLPIQVVVRGGGGTAVTYTPMAFAMHTSTLELSPGRVFTVMN